MVTVAWNAKRKWTITTTTTTKLDFDHEICDIFSSSFYNEKKEEIIILEIARKYAK